MLSMCVSQVYWTKEVGEAITTEGFKGLAKYGEKCTAELNKIVSLVRGQLTSLERATCGALVVIDVHARDVTVQVGMPTQTITTFMVQLQHALAFFQFISRYLGSPDHTLSVTLSVPSCLSSMPDFLDTGRSSTDWNKSCNTALQV